MAFASTATRVRPATILAVAGLKQTCPPQIDSPRLHNRPAARAAQFAYLIRCRPPLVPQKIVCFANELAVLGLGSRFVRRAETAQPRHTCPPTPRVLHNYAPLFRRTFAALRRATCGRAVFFSA